MMRIEGTATSRKGWDPGRGAVSGRIILMIAFTLATLGVAGFFYLRSGGNDATYTPSPTEKNQDAPSAFTNARAALESYRSFRVTGLIATETITADLPATEGQEVTIQSNVSLNATADTAGIGELDLRWATTAQDLPAIAFAPESAVAVRTLADGTTYTQSTLLPRGESGVATPWVAKAPDALPTVPDYSLSQVAALLPFLRTSWPATLHEDRGDTIVYELDVERNELPADVQAFLRSLHQLDHVPAAGLSIPDPDNLQLWIIVDAVTETIVQIDVQQYSRTETMSELTHAILSFSDFNTIVAPVAPTLSEQAPTEEGDGGERLSAADQRRVDDLRTIQTYLDAYHDQNDAYPLARTIVQIDGSDPVTTALVPAFAETLPHERDADYYYGYASDGQTYTLSAVLTATYDLDLPSVGERFLYTLRP